ncbi:MAG: hydrolase glyoxylase [Paenibacillus sp.]|nr:hydrolase glyoxylase [Paenibacillus sp.]
MKITRLSEHIWGLRTALPIQVWLVKTENGLILVDTGIPPMGAAIVKAISDLQSGPLEQIVLTHGHPDHVGGLEEVLRSYPVPVHAHAAEIPYMEGQLPYHPFKQPKVRVKPSISSPLNTDSEGRLLSFGGLTPFHTPGHSHGHVVYYHEKDQVLLAGDLFMTLFGRLGRPIPFLTPDMNQAIDSGSLVMELQPDWISLSHGRSMQKPHELYPAYRKRWKKD